MWVELASALRERLRRVRAETARICEPLTVDDHGVQSMPDVSPPKWHLAHTTWFFEVFVLAGQAPFDPRYAYLFNSYYEAVGERVPRARRGTLSRPTLAEVLAYRRHVDDALHALDDATLGRQKDAIELGIHHEQQHQELLYTDIQHILGTAPLRAAYSAAAPRLPALPSELTFTTVDGGVCEIGAPGHGFSFDNERPRHEVFVAPFRIADRPVRAGEWLEFMADGGYRRPSLWLSDGWATVKAEGWTAPLYWQRADGGAWEVYTLAGPAPLDLSAPVAHVSHYEADAYARWVGARLPTEAEWEVAVPPSRGLVWEWTASAYLPYPRFAPLEGAFGEYNGKFMSGQMVLRGGSAFTPAGHGRLTYRNFFPPGARWQLTGLRLAKDPR